MRIGRTVLGAGIGVLGVAMLVRALLGDPADGAMMMAIGGPIAVSWF